MADSDWWLYIVVAAGAVAIALVLLYATRTERRKKKEPPEKIPVEARESWIARALKTEHTITVDEAKKAKDELKIMDLEREVLSYAIRRLYEAQAEGKITEEERERLAQWYKSRMIEVRDTISRSESVVALHELETMQEDLVKLFSERFDELSKKVEEMRSQLQLKTVEEETLVPTIAKPWKTRFVIYVDSWNFLRLRLFCSTTEIEVQMLAVIRCAASRALHPTSAIRI